MSVDQKERTEIPYSPGGPSDKPENSHKKDFDEWEEELKPSGTRSSNGDFDKWEEELDPSLDRNSIQDAETNPSAIPYGDKPDKNRSIRTLFDSRKRKVIAGMIGGGSVGVFALFLGLLPFKVPGISNLITDAVGQRVEHIVTHRAKVVIARAILQRFGIKGGPVVTRKGPIDSLVATVRTDNFEKKLAQKGLKIEKYGDGVRLSTTDGFKSGSLKNEAEIVKIIQQNKVSRGAINQLVKEGIPAWRFMKRIKFATWLRVKYAIPFYGRDNKEPSDANPDDDAETKKAKKTAQAGIDDIEGAKEHKRGALKAFLNFIKGNGTNGSGQSNDPAIDGTEEAINSVIDEDAKVKKDSLKNASAKKVTEIMTKAGLETPLAFAKKAIPVYGWIMTYATIYSAADVIYESSRDGKLAQLLADIRGSQLAGIYGKYAGLASQYQLGEQDRDLMEYDASKFDGVEKSYIHRCVDTNYSSGCDQKGDKSGAKVNENVEGDLLASSFVGYYSSVLGIDVDSSVVAGGLDVIGATSYVQRKIARVLFWIDDSTIGAGFRTVFGGIGWVASELVAVIPGAQDAINAIKGVVDNLTDELWGLTLKLLGLSVNPLATGSELFNNMFAGGVYSMTSFCREKLGCHDISSALGKTQDNRFAQENSEHLQSKGLFYALFSPEVTTSVTSKLAMSMPSGAGNSTGDLVFRSSSRLLGSIAQLISPRLTGTSSADSIVTPASLVGMRETGFSDEELDSLVDDKVAYEEGYDCEGSTNPMCKVDKMLIETISICADPKNIESPECNPDSENEGPGNTTSSGAPSSGDSSTETTASGFAWPFGEANFKKYRSDYIGGHILSGSRVYSNSTNPILGAASDISQGMKKSGEKIFAMYGGTVKDAPVFGQGGLSIESDIGGKSMIITYMHGNNVQFSKGQSVKAGDHIMDMAMVGFGTGEHLHIQFEYDNTPLCIQDLFIAMEKGGTINLGDRSKFPRANPGCSGRR